MCIGHASFGNFRNDVFTEVVAGVFVFVVFFQQLIKVICIKDIDPHAGERFGVISRHGWWVGRFSTKSIILSSASTCITPNAVASATGTGRHATVQRAFLDVVDEHVGVVLLVDVIPGEDHDVLRVVAANDIEVLGHRISGAAVPVFTVNTLLGRQEIDKLIHLFAEE